MVISPVTSLNPATGIGTAWDLLTRLAALPSRLAASDAAPAAQPIQAQSMDSLTAALLDMGVTADAASLALADSFSRVGVPLTESGIQQGRALMGRSAEIAPDAVALASALDLPKTQAVMRALSQVIAGLPSIEKLPENAAALVTAAWQAGVDPSEIAVKLRSVIGRLAQSTENRIAAQSAVSDDPRAALLTAAMRADEMPPANAALAASSHLEGQQLLNQSSSRHESAPLYFAFFAQGPDRQPRPVEVQVWRRDEQRRDQAASDDPALRTVVRVSPARLGQIEVRLTGTVGGRMNIDLRSERPSTTRLMRKHAPDLAVGLTAAGWDVRQMNITQTRDFPPLWPGGEALIQPRTRLDWKA